MEYTATGPDGNDYTITGPAGATDEEVIAQIQKAVSPGAVESFGRAALNNFPLGQQAAAALTPGQDYSPALKQLNDQAIMAKTAHPIAYGAGAVAGSVAPLAIPGVGEALGAESMGTRALASGALGAAQAIGNTDLEQHPEEAAKQAIEGGLTGGALGAIIPGTQKAQEGLEDFANEKTIQSMGIPAKELGKSPERIRDMGNLAHEIGADTGSTYEKEQILKDQVKQAGKQLEDLGNGEVLVDYRPVRNELLQHMQESANVLGVESNPELKMYQLAIDRIRPGMAYEDLAQLKQLYKGRALDIFGNMKPNGEVPYNIYKTISDTMDKMISDHPEYKDLKTSYGMLKDMHTGVLGQLQREQATGIQQKGFGLAGKMGGMVLGGNVPLTVAAATAMAPIHPFMALGLGTTILNNPGAMASGARSLAGALPTMRGAVGAGAIDAMVKSFIDNPKSYGKFSAPLMQAVQQGGKQGFAATSYVLRQQHPELNQMFLDNAATNGPMDITNETQR